MSTELFHKGRDYRLVLKGLHEHLKPETYLEIGTREGGTLALADCPSIAIDPLFVIEGNPVGTRSQTFYFQMTSDKFFRKYDPVALLGGKLDFCFLDGLHEWETLLRDFMNVEKYCNPNSVIAIHDCYPLNIEMASRSDNGGWWTGDVWKIVPVLKKHRPDLYIFAVDAPPTGLVFITRLNPLSQTLNTEYFNILREWQAMSLEEFGVKNLYDEIEFVPTDRFEERTDIAKYFWI